FNRVIEHYSIAREYFGSDIAIAAYGELIRTAIELVNNDWPDSKHIPIAFTFDGHDKWKEAEEAYERVRNESTVYSDRMGYVGHADDKLHIPVQIGDLIAYEARYKTQLSLGRGTERNRFQKLIEQHNFYYIGTLGKDGLLMAMKKLA